MKCLRSKEVWDIKWLLAIGVGWCEGKETLLAITMGVDWGSWPPIIARSFRHYSGVNDNWENWFANWFWFEPQVESDLRCRLGTWLAMAFLGLDFMSDLVALVHSGTKQTTMTTLASLYLSCSSLYQNMSLYSWTLLQEHRFNKRSTSFSMASWSLLSSWINKE